MWIQRVIGQRVGCRLAEVERNEDGAGLDSRVGSGGQFDRATSTGNSQSLATFELQSFQVVGVNGHKGLGLDRIQCPATASHAAGVPVFQDTTGVEHKRKFVVGQFVTGW